MPDIQHTSAQVKSQFQFNEIVQIGRETNEGRGEKDRRTRTKRIEVKNSNKTL